MSKMEEYQGREKQEMRESYDAARNQQYRSVNVSVEEVDWLAFATPLEIADEERPRLRRRGRK